MLWRATAQEAKRKDGASRKSAMTTRIADGVPVGLLGYIDDQPVAWCSVAPRSTYRRLVEDGSCDEGVWSIACLFVVRRLRGRGITQQIITRRDRPCSISRRFDVEAYPVDPDSPSYRFMGFVPVFEKAGFCEVGRVGARRHVMQLKVKQ